MAGNCRCHRYCGLNQGFGTILPVEDFVLRKDFSDCDMRIDVEYPATKNTSHAAMGDYHGGMIESGEPSPDSLGEKLIALTTRRYEVP